MPAKEKRVPMRTCVGCREQKPKLELVRVVRTPEGEIKIDGPRGKLNGRGAYICPQADCFDKALKRKAFQHTFRTKLDSETLDQVKDGFIQRLLEEQS